MVGFKDILLVVNEALINKSECYVVATESFVMTTAGLQRECHKGVEFIQGAVYTFRLKQALTKPSHVSNTV